LKIMGFEITHDGLSMVDEPQWWFILISPLL
jgi:hypothetical protein